MSSPLGGAIDMATSSFFRSGGDISLCMELGDTYSFFVLTAVGPLILMYFFFTRKGEKLEGTKEVISKAYAELGPMKRDEKICGTLFLLAMIGAFTRPLFASALPSLEPAYLLQSATVIYVITSADKKNPIIT